MPDTPSRNLPPLARFEGDALFAAPVAMVKGLLEAETPVSLVLGPRREPFASILALSGDGVAVEQLRRHEIRVSATPTGARAVTLADHAARSGRGTVALVPNDELTATADALARAAAEPVRGEGFTVVTLEDHPEACPDRCPYTLARQLGLPAFVPADVEQLRDAVEASLRLARASGTLTALIVHHAVLCSTDTIAVRPNRVIESVDEMLARRRRGRRPRFIETTDVLRVVRRLEVNRMLGLPNPGERTPVGFVTVGPATVALRHVVEALRLVGRVPLMELAVAQPVDDVALSRLLGRCDRLVVLEPRPGTVEAAVLAVAEAMRRRGERPATVWGRVLPPDADGNPVALDVGHALQPSVLAHRAAHLLHLVRPSGKLATLLAPEPPVPLVPPRPRGAGTGVGAALARVRRLLVDVDQWLREQRPDDAEDAEPRSALAIDGAPTGRGPTRVVPVETWAPDRFLQEGVGAIRQAAREDRGWMFVVCDVGQEDGPDLERLVRGVIPAERADRVRIEVANLAETAPLAELLRESALTESLTIVIVRDGPPSICDEHAIERGLAEIDRLGFEPRQRVVWPVERACAIRPPVGDEPVERRSALDDPPLRSSLRIDRLPARLRATFRFSTRPLVEQVEVVRTRPPARRWDRDPASRLPLPEVVHRQAPRWRAHLAGFIGAPPGLAARILCRAGVIMGYRVTCQHAARPIGPGRRSWAQVLFTRPTPDGGRLALSGRIPFGEADLLLGLDAEETLRAVAADPTLRVADPGHTYGVVNAGLFSDEADTEESRAVREQLVASVRDATHVPHRLVEDFVGACRAWFHSDRVVSAALLGAAYQQGLIPTTPEAIETAVAEAEQAGHGRLREAFRFGRHLALDRDLVVRPKDEREERAARTVRRSSRYVARRRFGRRVDARRFRTLVERSVADMPGLAETDAGRQARRDVLIALYRCEHWGGVEFAERFAGLVADLYRADRGEAGRALTRNAVLPLAETMLVRDPIYVASMATSAEQRRRIRQVLNVKRARNDELSRRFLTRFELFALGRRYRADVRTSDWPARLLALIRPLVPTRWRGSQRERDLRDYVVDLVQRAARHGDEDYEHYQTALVRLHQQAVRNRLRGMTLAEARMLAEGTEGLRD